MTDDTTPDAAVTARLRAVDKHHFTRAERLEIAEQIDALTARAAAAEKRATEADRTIREGDADLRAAEAEVARLRGIVEQVAEYNKHVNSGLLGQILQGQAPVPTSDAILAAPEKEEDSHE